MTTRNTALAVILVTGSILVPGQQAMALPGNLLKGIDLGQDVAAAATVLKATASKMDARASRRPVTHPQVFAKGLLRTHLLSALNRAGAAHSLLKDPAKRRVDFAFIKSMNMMAVLGCTEGKVEVVLWRSQIRPDKNVGGKDNAFTPQRLAPIRGFVNQLRAAGCRISAYRKLGRNTFAYRGTCQKAKVFMEYHPDKNEFWTLFFQKDAEK